MFAKVAPALHTCKSIKNIFRSSLALLKPSKTFNGPRDHILTQRQIFPNLLYPFPTYVGPILSAYKVACVPTKLGKSMAKPRRIIETEVGTSWQLLRERPRAGQLGLLGPKGPIVVYEIPEVI